MIEIFIAIFLGAYYLFKYSLYKSRKKAYDADLEAKESTYQTKLEEWIKKTTDTELEKEVYEIVNAESMLDVYKKEIELVLKLEFGIPEGSIDAKCFNEYYGGYYNSAKKMFARILMANRGKVLDVDARFGIPTMMGPGTEDWIRQSQLYAGKEIRFSNRVLGFWINEQLKKHGISEAFILESCDKVTKKNATRYRHYYLIENEKDLEHIINALKRPKYDFSHAYYTRNCESMKWGASIRGFYTNSLIIEPADDYTYWHEV